MGVLSPPDMEPVEIPLMSPYATLDSVNPLNAVAGILAFENPTAAPLNVSRDAFPAAACHAARFVKVRNAACAGAAKTPARLSPATIAIFGSLLIFPPNNIDRRTPRN